mmetsp:Transcript_71974/g.187647  ORF Transcript_71974/g.187647 Transcript_71974/m.187647 type:complete len:342 (+) Transcript_71974:395-1420(+)
MSVGCLRLGSPLHLPRLGHHLVVPVGIAPATLHDPPGEGGRGHEILVLEREGHGEVQGQQRVGLLQLHARPVGRELDRPGGLRRIQGLPRGLQPAEVDILPAHVDQVREPLLLGPVGRRGQRDGLQAGPEGGQRLRKLARRDQPQRLLDSVLDELGGEEDDRRHVPLLEAAFRQQGPAHGGCLRHRRERGAGGPVGLLEQRLEGLGVHEAQSASQQAEGLLELACRDQVAGQLPLLQPLGLVSFPHGQVHGLLLRLLFFHGAQVQVAQVEADVHLLVPRTGIHLRSILVSPARLVVLDARVLGLCPAGNLHGRRHVAGVLELPLVEDQGRRHEQWPVLRLA